MDDLKLCPFCGWRAVIVDGTQPKTIGCFSVVCGYCFAATRWVKTKKEAVEAWNRRAGNG